MKSCFAIYRWFADFAIDHYTSVLFSHGPNKAFPLSDACRATERNGNSTSVDVTDDVIEND